MLLSVDCGSAAPTLHAAHGALEWQGMPAQQPGRLGDAEVRRRTFTQNFHLIRSSFCAYRHSRHAPPTIMMLSPARAAVQQA